MSERTEKQARIAAYKAKLREMINERPSGIRQKIAEITGTHKSFISQITNPSESTPLPARHIDAIFEVCHLSPEERDRFLELYGVAHPEHARPAPGKAKRTKTLHLQVPVLADERRQRELETLIQEFVHRVGRLIE